MNAHRPSRPSVAVGVCTIVLVLAAIVAALIAGMNMPAPPEPPPPPDDLNRLAQSILDNILPYFYWGLFILSSIVWGVLRWQRNPDESAAARWNRRYIIDKGLALWLSLALARTFLHEWLTIGYVFGVLVVSLVGLIFLGSLFFTYAVPIIKCRGGRCVNASAPLIDKALMPLAKGTEQRKG